LAKGLKNRTAKKTGSADFYKNWLVFNGIHPVLYGFYQVLSGPHPVYRKSGMAGSIGFLPFFEPCFGNRGTSFFLFDINLFFNPPS
jgi:hypothetical protein